MRIMNQVSDMNSNGRGLPGLARGLRLMSCCAPISQNTTINEASAICSAHPITPGVRHAWAITVRSIDGKTSEQS